MTNENALAVVDQEQINNLSIADVKKLWCPYVNDKEFLLFINLCKALNLNPFKREIHMIKYSEGDAASIVVGYEVYIKRAERTNKLNGWRVWIEGSGDSMVAKIEIHRKDWTNPFIHEVYFSEAAGYKKDGTLKSTWKKMPKFMLKKVAIGQAFRLCFSDELGGMPYLEEELSPESEVSAKPSFTPHQTTEVKDITPHKETVAPEVKDSLNAKSCTDEQVDKITKLILQTSKPSEWSDYICKAYKVDVYTQLSSDDAIAITKLLEEGIAEKKAKKETKKEEKKEELHEEPKDDQRPETNKVGKPITEKQLATINKMIEHFHDKKAGKLAVLLSSVGAGSLEKCTSYQASQILKVLIEAIKKDEAERKQLREDNP